MENKVRTPRKKKKVLKKDWSVIKSKYIKITSYRESRPSVYREKYMFGIDFFPFTPLNS